jgi:hypothetical protein
MASSYSPLFPFPAGATKRKAYFAFHYDDIMRVNNVRNIWKIDHPDALHMRSFYDSSLWESRQLEGPDALKRLIREGVGYTSAVCVLVGSATWGRRWVRYEIARAVVDKRGLLGVHINNINHHVTRSVHPLGENPLDYLGVGKVQEGLYLSPRYYIFEKVVGTWVRYTDYTDPVSLPPYLGDPSPGYVMPLSTAVPLYDFVYNEGHKNIGTWIDWAASAVGR